MPAAGNADGLDAARAILDRRLNRFSPAPLVVGLSGGSDSLSLLRLAAAWAAEAGRPLLAVTVDHGLNPQSPAWTQAAATAAQAVGAHFRALSWTGDKPTTGVPAAARAARHRLIAKAAREAGAGVILLGHTRDDVLETALMRQTGSTLGQLSEWSPSPVWPEGRGLFHLRPLIGSRRADLRRGLTAAGWGWIDDPANQDPRYARSRARRDIEAGAAAVGVPLRDDASVPLLAALGEARPWGGFTLDRSALCNAPRPAALRVLGAALACASGGETLPRVAKVGSLLDRLASEERVVAGLSGARLDTGDHVEVMREGGERARGGLGALKLPVGEPIVWDGRFEFTADISGLEVRGLGGIASRLAPVDQKTLKLIATSARGSLPAIVSLDGRVRSPVLAGVEGVRCRLLTGDRLRAACGQITREA